LINSDHGDVDLKKSDHHWCPRYITTSFVAEHCGVSAVTVLSWIEEKRLAEFRLPKGHYRDIPG
jgi:hypothetical protein